jgi:hypothetical protein
MEWYKEKCSNNVYRLEYFVYEMLAHDDEVRLNEDVYRFLQTTYSWKFLKNKKIFLV